MIEKKITILGEGIEQLESETTSLHEPRTTIWNWNRTQPNTMRVRERVKTQPTTLSLSLSLFRVWSSQHRSCEWTSGRVNLKGVSISSTMFLFFYFCHVIFLIWLFWLLLFILPSLWWERRKKVNDDWILAFCFDISLPITWWEGLCGYLSIYVSGCDPNAG